MTSLKDRDVNARTDSAAANLPAVSDKSSREQPVALEVPVTVNGARPLEGNDKREPFSESTKTVLVFGNGAVLRLGSAVAPGQLLFVTNERTKKEVVCQVVRSKTGKSSSGYVEVEFTEPVSGFWGLRFPADHAALRSRTSLSDPDSDADEFLRSAMDTSAPVTRKLNSAKPDLGIPQSDERYGTDLQSQERGSNRAGLLAEEPAMAPKLGSSRLQEQLSALISAEQETLPAERNAPVTQSSDRKALSDTTAKLFEMAEAKSLAQPAEPVPGESQRAKVSSALANASNAKKLTLPPEELKVPSWLQPLTRPMAAAGSNEEVANEIASASEQMTTPAEKHSKLPSKAKPPKAAPALGASLLGQSAAPATSHHRNPGLLIGVAAGLLVAAAGATWYFQHPSNPALTERSVKTSQAPTAPALPIVPSTPGAPAADATPSSSQQQPQPAQPDATARFVPEPLQSKPASGGLTETASASSSARLTQQPAVISERIPKSSPAANAPPAAFSSALAESIEPESKKPNLGDAALAKPKLKRRRQSAGIAAPSITETDAQAVSPDTSFGASLGPDAASQPAAPETPTPVGGDVKPAHLLSSVPPVYPPIAKSQHLAGDVRVDALIDANGRVSSMKVISGPAMLHQAAMDALRQWKYQPATLNGTAVPMHLTVTLQFHLQ